MNRRIVKKRRCKWCTVSLVTDADGLIAHSMEKHGAASPPRPEGKVSIRSAFSDMSMMGLLAKLMYGAKRKGAHGS